MYKPMALKVTAPSQGSITNYILVVVRKRSQSLASFKANYAMFYRLQKFNLVACNPC